MPKVIQKIIVFGDSLSDRGTMERSVLAPFSGLRGKSEKGRFTDAYVWFDYALRRLLGHTEVFGDDLFVGTQEVPQLARTYCVGGATAYNYQKVSMATEVNLLASEINIATPGEIFLEAITDPLESIALHHLKGLREACFRDDLTLDVSQEEKKQTLVVVWLGANDLVTINQPTEEAARLAVGACLQHVRAMLEKGYRNFVWFNMPSLDLTPRFQQEDTAVREAAEVSVNTFNEELSGDIVVLRAENPGCTFQLFDAHRHFKDAYNHMAQYGFDVAKKASIYTESAAFKREGPKAPESGYMFWDRLHPMRRVHELLGGFFNELFHQHYTFVLRAQDHLLQFREAYGMRMIQDKRRQKVIRSGLGDNKDTLGLQEIIHHGLFGRRYYSGTRTLSVMCQLGWVNQAKQSTKKFPLLEKFFSPDISSLHVLPMLDEEEGVDARSENSFESINI